MLKGIGFTDDDLAKPIIGVATTWIETMPCNLNQRELAQDVKRGIREAGGTPMEFNTIAVSDGVSMGTEAMRASLVSREVIADSIELVCARPPVRRARLPRRLRQDEPGGGDGARAARHPDASSSTRARSRPGSSAARDVTVADVYEAIGALRGRKDQRRGAARARVGRVPRRRRLRRPVHREHDVDDPRVPRASARPGLNGIPALSPKKAEAAAECGRIVVDLVRRDVRPSQIVTREAIENAAASVVATGGSTNGLLHLLAIAHEFGIPFTIDDFDRDRRRARRCSPT